MKPAGIFRIEISNESYFILQMGFNLVAVSLRQYRIQIHISHKIRPLNKQTNKHTNKQTKMSSQSHTKVKDIIQPRKKKK
jgi:hypothetical protein